MPLQTDQQQLGQIGLGCRLAAYSGGKVGTGQRCCWPLNADPLGGEQGNEGVGDTLLSEICTLFATSIYAKAAGLRSLDLTKRQQARVREAISGDIRKLTDLKTPEASRAALEEADRRGIDLFKQSWQDQPRFDHGRAVFHLEHVVTVAALRDKCIRCSNKIEIAHILRNDLRVAWILKSEDATLTRLGFRSKREDPEDAYAKAGIQLHTGDRRPTSGCS